MAARQGKARPRALRRFGADLQTLSMKIDRVALQSFKGHKSLELDMAKITVLIGPTSSGKSTVLQALNLLKSALETEGRILSGNAGRDHDQFTDIAAGGDEDAEVGIGVSGHKTVQTGGGHTACTEFKYNTAFDSSLYPGMLDATVDVKSDPDPQGVGGLHLSVSSGVYEGSATVSGAATPDGMPVQAKTDRGLLPHMRVSPSDHHVTEAFNDLFSNGVYFRSLLDELYHIPFSRVVTAREHPIKHGEDPLSPDRAAASASMVSHISSDNALRERISDMLDAIGLRRIEVRTLPSARIKGSAVALDLAKNGSRHTLVHEGSGLNQLVALLTTLASSPRGSVVTIEEPELHLDPAAQARLMKVVVEQAVKEDKQIIFTTHSDHLLYPLLAYVEKDGYPLESGDVAMYYFDTNESGAVAGAERLPMNDRGQIRGGLRGFWDADMKAMDDILG